jgi:hypothetical protein
MELSINVFAPPDLFHRDKITAYFSFMANWGHAAIRRSSKGPFRQIVAGCFARRGVGCLQRNCRLIAGSMYRQASEGMLPFFKYAVEGAGGPETTYALMQKARDLPGLASCAPGLAATSMTVVV